MCSASSIQLPYLALNAVRECHPIDEESPMPIRARSSVLKIRERATPSFNALQCKPCGSGDQKSPTPYQSVSLKSWNLPSTISDEKRPVPRKLNQIHKRDKLHKQYSFNSSQAQFDSGYDTVASVSTAAESYFPSQAQSYATSAASSRASSRRGDARRMELNTTRTAFPRIKKPIVEVVDLSGEAIKEARPFILNV